MNRDISVEGRDFSVSSFDEIPSLIAAAHELKSPLSLIRQLSLELNTDKNISASKRKLIDQIQLTSELGLRLTTNLTKASRLEDSIFELDPVNPRVLCQQVADDLRPLYHAKGRDIEVSAPKRPLLALANRDLLYRIILNFGDNALHYAQNNEIVQLKISSLNRGKKIRIGVRDFGPYVASDVWQRLRRELGKTSQSIHARPASSGLGLYIASKFANSMNGSIGAIRHRDGATFYVTVDSSLQLSLI